MNFKHYISIIFEKYNTYNGPKSKKTFLFLSKWLSMLFPTLFLIEVGKLKTLQFFSIYTFGGTINIIITYILIMFVIILISYIIFKIIFKNE